MYDGKDNDCEDTGLTWPSLPPLPGTGGLGGTSKSG